MLLKRKTLNYTRKLSKGKSPQEVLTQNFILLEIKFLKKMKNNLYNFKNENLNKEEEEKLLLDSKNETLKSHLKQLKLFIESNDNLEEIISLNPKDESVYYEYSQVLEVIQRKINKNNRSVANG